MKIDDDCCNLDIVVCLTYVYESNIEMAAMHHFVTICHTL